MDLELTTLQADFLTRHGTWTRSATMVVNDRSAMLLCIVMALIKGEAVMLRMKSILLGSCLSAAFCVGSANAQPLDAQPESAQPQSVEEDSDVIVVTAQKRAENVQDVPVSISVIGGERLDRLEAGQLTDYAAYIPGFQVDSNGSPGQAQITLRGINPIGSGSAVGIYIDDSPLGSSSSHVRAATFALDLMPYDIERVEVLRGPQGTLYGASTMGGLVKYVTRAPDLNDLEIRAGGDMSTIRGSDDLSWGVRAGVNLPVISDKLAIRASYYRQHTAGYIDGLASENRNELDQEGGRISLLWKPTEDVSVRLAAMLQNVDSDSRSAVSLLPSLQPRFGDLVDGSALFTPFTSRLRYYTGTLNWDLDWASLVSATSYSKTKTAQRQDGSAIYVGFANILTGGAVTSGTAPLDVRLEVKKFTQEVRLVSPGGGKIEWIVGAFYTKEKAKNFQNITIFDLNGVPIVAPTFIPGVMINPFADGSLPSSFEEYAGFADLTYKFSDRFDITAGLRVAHNKQKFETTLNGAIAEAFNNAGTNGGNSSETVVTYMVSPRFHVTRDVLLYARVASGYRPGGPNVQLLGAPPEFDADTLTNYEVGLKSEFFNRSLLFNFTVYQIDWNDIQLTVPNPAGSYGGNGGAARSRGFELETVYFPISGLRLGFNAAHTDAVLTEDSPPPSPGIRGDRLPQTPRWSGAITADYDFALSGGWNASLGGGFRFVGSRDIDLRSEIPFLPPNFRAPSYEALDLYAGVSNEHFNIRLFAKNLTDERAYLTINYQPTLEGVVLQPRTFGISLDTTF